MDVHETTVKEKIHRLMNVNRKYDAQTFQIPTIPTAQGPTHDMAGPT